MKNIIKFQTKTARTAQMSIPCQFNRSLEQRVKGGLKWKLQEREGNATVLSKNDTRQREGLDMLLKETQGEQKISDDNADGRGYPLARSKPEMPRPCSPMGILGLSNKYVTQDLHPLLSKKALPPLD